LLRDPYQTEDWAKIKQEFGFKVHKAGNTYLYVRTIRIASEYFDSDSSFTAKWKPFIPFRSTPNFYEYPVIPPSDTFFRGRGTQPREAASVVIGAIEYCNARSIYCTLLLHPNAFVIELLNHLREHTQKFRDAYPTRPGEGVDQRS
jgi:hypothetical protein